MSCGEDEKGPSKPIADSSAKKEGVVRGEGGGSTPPVASETATEFADAAPVVDSAASFGFTIRPRVGDIYHYRIAQKANTQVDSMKGIEETVYAFHQKITGLNDDGSLTMEMIYDSIRYNLNLPPSPLNPKAESFSYSTRQKPDEKIPVTVQAHALIGRKVNLTISARGEVSEVSNIEPIVSAMLGRYRDSLSPQDIEQVRAGVKISAYQAMVAQLFLRSRPNGQVRLGHTWNRRDTVPIGGIPMSVAAVYRLAEVRNVGDDPVGRIAVDLAFSFPRKKFDLPGGSITLDQAEATGRGEVIQNLTTGFPTRKTNRIDVRLRMTARSKEKNAETGAQTRTVSQRMTQTLTIEMVDYTRGE